MVVHAEVKQFNVIIWKIGQKKKRRGVSRTAILTSEGKSV